MSHALSGALLLATSILVPETAVACTDDTACRGDDFCIEGTCQPLKCSVDVDCPDPYECHQGACALPRGPLQKDRPIEAQPTPAPGSAAPPPAQPAPGYAPPPGYQDRPPPGSYDRRGGDGYDYYEDEYEEPRRRKRRKRRRKRKKSGGRLTGLIVGGAVSMGVAWISTFSVAFLAELSDPSLEPGWAVIPVAGPWILLAQEVSRVDTINNLLIVSGVFQSLGLAMLVVGIVVKLPEDPAPDPYTWRLGDAPGAPTVSILPGAPRSEVGLSAVLRF